jgi:hypothetical protein
MKFAVIRLACFFSRQQTLSRAIAVASRIVVHGTLHDPARMRSLTDRRLYKIAHRASPQSK